jgi:hypothetical protein
MVIPFSFYIRNISAFLPEVNIKKKVYQDPKLKPPRRNPSIDNKTNQSDYMKNYMTEYREKGKDYQKVPDKVKQFRREQRKQLREKIRARKPVEATLIDQELTFWRNAGKTVDLDEFQMICSRRGFEEESWKILAEELIDENLL